MLGLASRSRTPNRNFVTDLLNSLIAFVSAHVWLAYLTLFLAALLEAVPVIAKTLARIDLNAAFE